MNILVVNDDGVSAEGIKKLALALKKYGNVIVCAPNIGRSAAGHSIVLHDPISFEYLGNLEGIQWYQTSGTPVDCVRLSLDILEISFDVVFSGINDGLNIGTDIIYSGTVSAAREANIEDIPAVAISTDYGSFNIVDKELDTLLEFIFKNQLFSKNYVLNINFPEGKFHTSVGYRCCKQGIKKFKTHFIQTKEGTYINADCSIVYDEDPQTDVYLAHQGFITFVPLQVEQTKEDSLYELLSRDL